MARSSQQECWLPVNWAAKNGIHGLLLLPATRTLEGCLSKGRDIFVYLPAITIVNYGASVVLRSRVTSQPPFEARTKLRPTVSHHHEVPAPDLGRVPRTGMASSILVAAFRIDSGFSLLAPCTSEKALLNGDHTPAANDIAREL